jgi:hypothetical protein
MIVQKKEFEDLKDELEKEKNTNYAIQINMTKTEKQMEMLKRDHANELETITEDMNTKSKVAYEELVLKHNDERNRLI